MAWQNYSGGPPIITVGPTAAVTQVRETMARMEAQTTTYTAKVDKVLEALQAINIVSPGPAPTLTVQHDNGSINWNTTALSGLALPEFGPIMPNAPDPINLAPIDPTLNMPTFDAGVTINVPSSPSSIQVGAAPSRPVYDTNISLPDKPVLIQPIMEAFEAIHIPAFVFPTLPAFTDTAPTFDQAAPNVSIDWAEPEYQSENFELMLGTVRRMISGGTGLPDEIERQLFDKARAREDITARKSVAEAFDVFAGKGFTMPPGMLAEQVNAAREQNQLQVNALSRDVYIKVADIAVENLRFAVTQGVAAENILSNIFNNAQTRAFEMEKFTVESQLALYNTQVSLFNAYMNAYQIKASVYKTRLDAALAELEGQRAYLEGQKIISEINQQKVQTFLAKTQALNAQVEIYKAEMEGARVKASVIQTLIEGYKADVSAYAERIGADKVRFDAYKSQVEAEVSKVGIIDAKARVFASMAGVETSRAEIRIKTGQLAIEQVQAQTARYGAQLETVRTNIAAQVARTEAQARVHGLTIQNLSAQSDANRAKAEAQIRIAEQQLQSNLAGAANQLKLYEFSVTQVLEQARLKVSAMQAAGTMAATLAGGAMAAQHVQASISSGYGQTDSNSHSFTEGATESWNYTPNTSN